MTIDDSFGPVEAAGIVVTNGMKEWQYNRFDGSPLHVGADGVTVHTDTPNTFVDFNCPVVLTAPQTWRNAKVKAIDVGGTVTLANVLSSAPGIATPIAFDGVSRVDPSLKGMTHARPVFAFDSDNVYFGPTTIRGGAVLYLRFSPAFSRAKIDSASALILSGGGLAITGQEQAFTQRVARLVVRAGENFIGGKNATAVFDCGEIVREGLGGTMSFPVSWAGGTTAYANNTNINAILGGWALLNDGAFAAMNVATRAVGQNSGSQCWTTDDWGDNKHVTVYGGGVRTLGDASPFSIRYQAGQTPAPTNDLGEAAVTIKSGGLAVNNTAGCKLANGRLRSGHETGELFVFAAGPFEISSRLEDNGATPLTLVKAQSGALTLSGELAYTGDTYLNGGTLILAGAGAALAAAIHQAGGTTLRLENGAKLACAAGGRVLNGNLDLGPGACLDLVIGAKDDDGAAIVPLALTNPRGSFAVSATDADPVRLSVAIADGAEIGRGVCRLIRWPPGAAATGVVAEAFAATLPHCLRGELAVSSTSLDLVVTGVSGGSLLFVK